MTFQKGVLAYIASQQLGKEDEEKLKDIFSFLDSDKDGRITETELVKAYKTMGKSESESIINAKWIMNAIDLNKNGTIDYNEFLMANLNKTKALTKTSLEKAFKYFDRVKLLS